MKKLIIFILIGFCSCSTNEESKPDATIQESEKIQTTDSLGSNSSSITTKKIKIQVYYTHEYCGGAPPNEEILAELNKKRWFQNSEMRIYSMTDNLEEIIFTTNHEGIAEVELLIGNSYTVLVGKKPHEQMSHLYDPACTIVTEKSRKQFTITENGIDETNSFDLTVMIDFPCDPCDPSIKMRP